MIVKLPRESTKSWNPQHISCDFVIFYVVIFQCYIKGRISFYRALYERMVILEQANREKDIVIGNMSKQLSAISIAERKRNNELVLRFCDGNYVWRVDNFRARLDAMLEDYSKMLYSPGFYTSPNGYRSVFLYIVLVVTVLRTATSFPSTRRLKRRIHAKGSFHE